MYLRYCFVRQIDCCLGSIEREFNQRGETIHDRNEREADPFDFLWDRSHTHSRNWHA